MMNLKPPELNQDEAVDFLQQATHPRPVRCCIRPTGQLIGSASQLHPANRPTCWVCFPTSSGQPANLLGLLPNFSPNAKLTTRKPFPFSNSKSLFKKDISALLDGNYYFRFYSLSIPSFTVSSHILLSLVLNVFR
jgi:hypothetical protein